MASDDRENMGEDSREPPRFHVGERVRHRTAGICFVYGYIRRDGTWLYDLYPSLVGGDIHVGGHWYWLDTSLLPFSDPGEEAMP